MTQELNLAGFLAKLSAPMDEIFLEQQSMTPMWVVEGQDGLTVIETPWTDDKEKAEMVQFVKKRMKEVKATRYVHIAEVWMAEVRKMPESIKLGGKVSSHPDRREAIMAIAEDKNGNVVHRRRFILRPENGEATLAPAEVTHLKGQDVDGTLTHLLDD